MRAEIIAALEASLAGKVWYPFPSNGPGFRFTQLEQTPFSTALWVRLTDPYGNTLGIGLEGLLTCDWDWDYL